MIAAVSGLLSDEGVGVGTGGANIAPNAVVLSSLSDLIIRGSFSMSQMRWLFFRTRKGGIDSRPPKHIFCCFSYNRDHILEPCPPPL